MKQSRRILCDTLRCFAFFAVNTFKRKERKGFAKKRKEEVCYFFGFIATVLSLAYTGKTKLRSVRILVLLKVTAAD